MAFRLQLLSLVLLYTLFYAHAKCVNPSVRREWRKLSKKDRAEWVGAIRCLNKLPHTPALTPTVNRSLSLIPPVNTSGSFWDDISYLHMDLNILVHYTGFFLPWHRAYVWGVEKAMKDKCGYKGAHPYWDWTLDAADFYHATIFDDDPESGIGGWGDPNNDFQITTGGFVKDFTPSYPSPHKIRRNFSIQPFPELSTAYINLTFTKSNCDYMVNSFVADYQGFQAFFEALTGPHTGPHLIVGGDMTGYCPTNAPPDCVWGPKWTPNDPLFFMHHAMVDKLWYDWQNKDPKNRDAFLGGSVGVFGEPTFDTFRSGAPPFLNFASQLPGDGLLWKNLTIWDVMKTNDGALCYEYN